MSLTRGGGWCWRDRAGKAGAEILAGNQQLLFKNFKEGKRFYRIALEFGVLRR